jgi:perosamine synthetase
MVTRKIIFAKPYFTEADLIEISNGVQSVLQSGWLTSGPNVQKMEERFAQFIGSSSAVAVNSCTAALHAILLGLDVKEGDEVIVPSNTFVATANSALYVGARPVFADSDPDTFNISYKEIQNKITDKTKAIIVVHLGGNPCDMREIREIAEDRKVALIEDCAHAHGAKYGENYCGNLGVAGAFSFYPTKVMTMGEGGIVTTNDMTLAQRIKVIRNCGRAGYGPLEISEIGYNYRLSDIHAVIGLSQLNHLAYFIKQRNLITKAYDEVLFKIGWMKPQHVRCGNLSSYYAYIVKLTSAAPLSRDEVLEKLKKYEIMTSVLYHPVHLQPLYINWFRNKPPSLPVAEELGRTSFALPLHNGMSKDDVGYVVDTLWTLFA